MSYALGRITRRQAPSTVTNKFRDVVGRVTPCALFGKLSADRGAHGVTRPTRALHDVTKLIGRGTGFKPQGNSKLRTPKTARTRPAWSRRSRAGRAKCDPHKSALEV